MIAITYVTPKKIHIKYQPEKNDTYVISKMVDSIPLFSRWDEETLEELKDKKHVKTIKKARLEYSQGKIIEEDEVMKILAD